VALASAPKLGPASHQYAFFGQGARHLFAGDWMLEAWEEVEGALAGRRLKSIDSVQSLLDQQPPLVVLRSHSLQCVLRSGDGRHRGLLRNRVGADHKGFVKPHEIFDDGRVGHQIAHSPTGHGIGLGEAVDQDCPVFDFLESA